MMRTSHRRVTLIALLLLLATLPPAHVVAQASHNAMTATLGHATAPSANTNEWSTADKINLVTAIATSGYFLATLILISFMARANRIARDAAIQSSELARRALEQTQRSNELTQQVVAAAAMSARVAQQQFDSQLLDKYLPIESAIGSALGNIRGSRVISETLRFKIVSPEFTAAVQTSAAIGGSLHATLQLVGVSLQAAQSHRDSLVQALETMPTDDPFVKGLRELVELHRRGAELVLEAAASEIKVIVDRLRESTGRQDVTLSHLDPDAL
jgi:hypothetical protein